MKISMNIDLDTDRQDAVVIYSDTSPDAARDIKVLLEAVSLISSILVKEGKPKEQLLDEARIYLSSAIDDYIKKGEIETRMLKFEEA